MQACHRSGSNCFKSHSVALKPSQTSLGLHILPWATPGWLSRCPSSHVAARGPAFRLSTGGAKRQPWGPHSIFPGPNAGIHTRNNQITPKEAWLAAHKACTALGWVLEVTQRKRALRTSFRQLFSAWRRTNAGELPTQSEAWIGYKTRIRLSSPPSAPLSLSR